MAGCRHAYRHAINRKSMRYLAGFIQNAYWQAKVRKKMQTHKFLTKKWFFFQKIVSHACVYKKKAVSLQNFKTNDKFLYINPKI